MSRNKIESFFKKQGSQNDRYIASRYHLNDRLEYDTKFILQYLPQRAKVLDLGCGTGLLEDTLHNYADEILAVDKFNEFLEKANPYGNVKYVCEDIATFSSNDTYDLILLYGVTIYLSDEELLSILKSCFNMLTSTSSYLIVKNQWGINECVEVDGYSEGLQSDYYAVYRNIKEMKSLFSQLGFEVFMVDLYPQHMNLWDNTHEYAFVCKKTI